MAASHVKPTCGKPAGRVATLKRRAEFLRVRGGARCATPAFVLEAKRRGDEAVGARFGFTVSKQVGGAVERNRIKRRLRAAVRDVMADRARPDYDYVLVARRPALDTRFASLVADLVHALDRVHRSRAQGGQAASKN
jgi:ribonuclease P protein component